MAIRRDEVEERALKALREKLLRKDLFDEFCREFTKEMNRLRMAHRAGVAAAKRELQHLEARRARLVESIMEGVPGREVKDELIAIGARRDELEHQLAVADQAPPLLPPNMADLYREKVAGLAEALEHPDTRPEATETLRGLIDEMTLTPVDGTLQIELKGNLAAMLGAAPNAKRSPETGDLSLQIALVAGARKELYRQLCWAAA